MNDGVTISTLQLFAMFPDQEVARVYLEERLWPNGVKCPECGFGDRITNRKGGYYRCNHCKLDFTVRTGTIFERSHVPLHKWIYAIYLLVTSRKGISSMQLSKEIGITQKSAWFVLHRLREACGSNLPALKGIVEIDESYLGGKEKNKHAYKKLKQSRGGAGKTPVIGMRERGGNVVMKTIEGTDTETVHAEIRDRIEEGSMLHTDQHSAYEGLEPDFGHESVNHTAGEYVRGEVTINGMESVWAVLKRGMHGIYHHCSEEHLPRYLNEFGFRLNEANVKVHTLDRLASLVGKTVGKRITYKRLIGKEDVKE